MNREDIYAALFALVASCPGFVVTSRRLRHWNDVTPLEQPYLAQAQRNELSETTPGYPTKWTFNLDIYVYARTDGGLAPGPIINPLLDALTAALAPPEAIDNLQTLGGLVTWVRIDGAIETDEGTLGDQTVAIIPVSIFVG